MPKEGTTTGDKEKKRKIAFSGDEGNREVRDSPGKRITRSATATSVKESSGVDEATRREQIREGKRPVLDSRTQPHSTKIKIGVPKLPPKLLERSEIPKVGKINSYSKTEHLLAITEVLHGTTEYQTLLESDLGKVFELTTKRGALSGKVVHNMLCRMLLTRKKRELWFVFANRPIRYSLKEFGYLTGMNCGPTPPKDQALIDLSKSKDAYWHELIGPNQTGIIRDLVLLLQRDKRLPAEDQMPMSRRFRLALVILVDGVLCCKNCATVKASRLTIEMVKDIDSFLAYPWGRLSFELTLEMVTPGNFQNPTIDDLVQRLTGQANVAIKGFTAAFQLLLYETCSNVKAVLEEDETVSDFTNHTMVDLPKSRNFSNKKLADIEDDPKTTVISILDYEYKLIGGDFSWPDEIEDSTVHNMLKRIGEGYQWKKTDWTKGVIEFPRTEDEEKTKTSKKTKRGTSGDLKEEDYETLSDDERMLDEGKGNSAKKRGKPRGRSKKKARTNVEDDFEEIEEVNPTIEKVWKAMLPSLEKLFKKSIMDIISGHTTAKFDGAGTSNAQPHLRENSSQVSQSQNIVSAVKADSPKLVDMNKNMATVSPKSMKEVVKDLENTGMLDNKVLEDSDEESDSEQLVRKKVVEKELPRDEENDSFDLDDALTEKLEESNIGSDVVVKQTDYNTAQDVQVLNEENEVLNVDQFDDEVQLPDDDIPDPVNKDLQVERPTNEPIRKPSSTHLQPSNMDEGPTHTAIQGGTSTMSIDQQYQESEYQAAQKVIDAQSSKVDVYQTNQQSEYQSDNESEDQSKQEPVHQTDVFQQVDAYQETTVTVCEGSSKEVGDGADSETLGVRQPSTRARKKTVKFGQEELQLGLGPVDKALVTKFLNNLAAFIPDVYMIKQGPIPKTFFTEIYTKTNHVNTTHMDLILESVWSRCGQEFLKNRSLLVDIFFIQHLLTDHATYPFKDESAREFKWHKTISQVIDGSWTKRPGNIKLYDYIDKVYAPMHWDPDHWVGLCIDLIEGRITIFDSQINYVKRAKMIKTMQPLMEILPKLVKHIAAKSPNLGLEVPSKFTCERPSNVSQNTRSGDCGPLSIKYMELHAQGKPLDGITEKMVDNLRMHYAIDVYQKFAQVLS